MSTVGVESLLVNVIKKIKFSVSFFKYDSRSVEVSYLWKAGKDLHF